jgi:SAM-dependent methyltransferase
MTYDLIDQSQRGIRRAGEALRHSGLLPQDLPAPRCDEAVCRDAHFANGAEHVAHVAEQIEAHTGRTLDGRRALDFGCGFGRMALPLAQRCEHVYGLDISAEALRAADSNARRMNIANVCWLDASKLVQVAGRYDLVLSHWVFPHIPSRQGERILARLLQGLRPGGLGAIHITVRPAAPLKGLFLSDGSLAGTYSPMRLLRRIDWNYAYLLVNSHSLNRLCPILADAGVNDWLVDWHKGSRSQSGPQPFQSATLIFAKGSPSTS